MSCYDQLAACYDELTGDVAYEKRADYLEKLCRQNPGGILDRFIHAARKLPGPEGEIALKEGIAALLAAAEKRH